MPELPLGSALCKMQPVVGHLIARIRQQPLVWTAGALVLFALGRVVVSLWPVTTPLHQRDGFAEAVAHLEQAASADAFVVVWPPEQVATLEHLPARLNAADAVPTGSEHNRQYRQIWVIGPVGFDAPVELADADTAEAEIFGDVAVRHFSFAAVDRILFDLRSRLSEVRVSMRAKDTDLSCDKARADGGFDCPGRPPWNHVGQSVLRVEGEDWRCVWAHPVTGHQLTIDLGEQLLADRIELHAALADQAVSTPRGATVHLRLEVGDASQRLARPNQRGIAKLEMPTERGARAPVRVVITTSNDGRRHLGINLRIVESAGEADTPNQSSSQPNP